MPFAAPDSLAIAFAPQDFTAARLTVRDSADRERDASLVAASPNQISFLVPAATAPGLATVRIQSGTNTTTHGLSIQPVAPGVFTAHASGQGVPAAQLVFTDEQNNQRVENVFRLNPATNQYEPEPLNLASGRNHTLVLYLTGARGRSSLSNAVVRIGSQMLPVQYAGHVAGFPGLDQINVALPASIRATSPQRFSITIDGRSVPDGLSLLLN